MKLLDWWHEERDRQFIDRWEREHRWSALGRYNAEVRRGIVHTPEWDALMSEEQAKFNAEHGGSGHVFPITLEPG